MKDFEIRRAKTALLDKSILGYRNPADGSRRSERASKAKVGAIKSKADGRLVRVTDAKVGLPKIGT